MLVENRAVVADVQLAVEPDRVSPQDVAARMPAATASVRAYALAMSTTSLCRRVRISRVERHRHTLSCSRSE